ncbi:MAG: hypothetical protein ACYCWW_00640 [Deltaproteobacteria bacterium]
MPPGPDAGDSNPAGAVGPCQPDGGCAGQQYCQPLLTQCSGLPGVSVILAPGNCYLDNPCGLGGCEGVACGADLDCGSQGSCQTGICSVSGQPNPFGGSSTGGSGGGQSNPTCPNAPSPCPPGCGSYLPTHGCQVCLCPVCPEVDGG